jgi:hypothetical protein
MAFLILSQNLPEETEKSMKVLVYSVCGPKLELGTFSI